MKSNITPIINIKVPIIPATRRLFTNSLPVKTGGFVNVIQLKLTIIKTSIAESRKFIINFPGFINTIIQKLVVIEYLSTYPLNYYTSFDSLNEEGNTKSNLLNLQYSKYKI